MCHRRRTAFLSRASRRRRPRSPERGSATVRRYRGLVVSAALALTVSIALVLYASTNPPDALPAWGGPFDVAVAAALFVIAFRMWSRAQWRIDASALHATHIVAAMLPALTVAALWVWRDRLDFNVLLPGLAWRMFLVLYSLPSVLTVWRQPIRL